MTSVIPWTASSRARSAPIDVEARHEAQHLAIALVGERALFDRRRIDADAKRLGEDQRVAWARFRVASERLRRDEADDGEAVDRLGRIDGMAARDRDSRFRRHRRAAAQDFADHAGRHAVDRHAEDRQREDRLAPHRIDVGKGVGRGDTAEVERIVDHRHEEVGGRDDAGLVVKPPYRGVVAGLRADQEAGEGRARRLLGQQFAQDGGGQLATAAAAMGERGQAKDRGVHGGLVSAVVNRLSQSAPAAAARLGADRGAGEPPRAARQPARELIESKCK